MAQLEHVDVTDDNLLIEGFSRPAIINCRFARLRDPSKVLLGSGFAKVFSDLFLGNPIEDWSCDLEAQSFGGDAQMSFQYLADVHPAGHAQRVKHNVHRSSIRQEGHVFLGNDLGNHSLVAMPSSHFVADGQLSLTGDINFHLLDDSGINVIAALDPAEIFILFAIQVFKAVLVLADDLADLVPNGTRVDLDVIVNRGQLPKKLLGDLAICRNNDLARLCIYDVERNFLVEQDIRKRCSELLVQFVFAPLVVLHDHLLLTLPIQSASSCCE